MKSFAVSVVLLGMSFCTVHAQEIKRPQFTVGEWCEYAGDIGASKQRREVVAVESNGAYTLKYVSSESGEELRTYDQDGLLTRRGDREFKRLDGTTIFPISPAAVGKSNRFSFPHARRPGVTMDATRTVTAVTPERVVVPGGQFDTYRIELVTRYTRSDGYTNQWTDTLWYPIAAAAKFPVKLEFFDYSNPRSRTVWSMVSCGGPSK